MQPFSVRCGGGESVPEVGPGAHFMTCRTASSVCEEPVAGPPARNKTGSTRRRCARPEAACPSFGRLDGADPGRGVCAPDNDAERRFLTGSGVVCLGGAGLLSYAACSVLQFEAGHAGGGRGLPAELLLLVAAFVLFLMGLWSFGQAGRTSPAPDTPKRQEC
jgi:hypothetical protein